MVQSRESVFQLVDKGIDFRSGGGGIHEDGFFAGQQLKFAVPSVGGVGDRLHPIGIQMFLAAIQKMVPVVGVVSPDTADPVFGFLVAVFV